MVNKYYFDRFSLGLSNNNRKNEIHAKLAYRVERADLNLGQESIQAAQEISQSQNGATLGLLLQDDYESAVTFLSFLKAGVAFKAYRLVFAENPPTASTVSAIESLTASVGVQMNRIEFNFGHEEHLTGLDRLRETTSSMEMENLFRIWAVCQIDEMTILPGQFVGPVHGFGGEVAQWTLPGITDLSLHVFLKEFGGVPSFMTSKPEMIYGQVHAQTNRLVIDMARHGRLVQPMNAVYRRLLARDFGFAELVGFAPPVRLEHEAKIALKKFSRQTKEDFASIMHRLRIRGENPEVVQNIEYSPVAVDDELKKSDVYLELFNTSSRADIAGGILETNQKTSETECLAAYPLLISLHQYQQGVGPVKKFVESLEYFNTYGTSYTRTDLHLQSPFSELVEFFNKSISFYFKKMGYIYDTFEIVQCWANRSEYSEKYHQHKHPNSMLSGVFYLTEGGGGDMAFNYQRPGQFVFNIAETTEWNNETVTVSPKTGRLALFPSWLEHETRPHLDQKSRRYSIAFNVIPRGEIGDLAHGPWINL